MPMQNVDQVITLIAGRPNVIDCLGGETPCLFHIPSEQSISLKRVESGLVEIMFCSSNNIQRSLGKYNSDNPASTDQKLMDRLNKLINCWQ